MFLWCPAMNFPLIYFRLKIGLPTELKPKRCKTQSCIQSTRTAACQLRHVSLCIIIAKLQTPASFAACSRHCQQSQQLLLCDAVRTCRLIETNSMSSCLSTVVAAVALAETASTSSWERNIPLGGFLFALFLACVLCFSFFTWGTVSAGGTWQTAVSHFTKLSIFKDPFQPKPFGDSDFQPHQRLVNNNASMHTGGHFYFKWHVVQTVLYKFLLSFSSFQYLQRSVVAFSAHSHFGRQMPNSAFIKCSCYFQNSKTLLDFIIRSGHTTRRKQSEVWRQK